MPALAVFASCAAGGAASAQQTMAEMERLLLHSAATEWVFTHCDDAEFDPGYLLAAQLALDQVGAAAEVYRASATARIEADHDTTEDACAQWRWVALPD
jgi:hypothetical protein